WLPDGLKQLGPRTLASCPHVWLPSTGSAALSRGGGTAPLGHAPRLPASQSQLPVVISIKALRFEVTRCPLWSEAHLFAVTGIKHWVRSEFAAAIDMLTA